MLASLENHKAELHQMLLQVADGPGTVLLWHRCDRLCTSGFVGDVMFSQVDHLARQVKCIIAKRIAAEIPTIKTSNY